MKIFFLDAETSLSAVAPPAEAPLRLLALEDGPGTRDARRILSETGGTELDPRALAAELAETFPRRFADFVAALNHANASEDWWRFRVHEKNPLFTRLPLRCFHLLLIIGQRADTGTLWVTSADPVLARQVALWGKANNVEVTGTPAARETLKQRLNRLLPGGPLLAFLRSLGRLLRVRAAVSFKPDPAANYAVIATLVNHQSFDKQGRYRDTYFGDLPRHLTEGGLSPLVFGSITHEFGRSLSRLSAQTSGYPLIPMETFLSFGALFRLLGQALRRRRFDFPLRGPLKFEGIEVSLFVLDDMRANARDSRLFSDMWYHECAAALFRAVKIERIFFPFENRVWERMITLAARAASPSTEIIGYQHSSLTDEHLNVTLGKGEADVLPLPDRIITNGRVTLDWLRARGGFPPARLAQGCALRSLAPRSPARAKPDATGRVLVVLANSPREAGCVLRLLDRTFPNGGPDLLLRPHPTIPLASGLALSGPVRFAYRREPAWSLQECMDWAGTVLFASSTAGLEAVRQGIPTIFLDITDFLRTDPLAGFADLKWTARKPDELRAALAEIGALSPRQLAERRRAAASYCARYLAAVTPETLAPFLRRGAHNPLIPGAIS